MRADRIASGGCAARTLAGRVPTPIVNPVAAGDDLDSRPEVRAMLAVSSAVVRGGSLADILGRIAAEATGVVDGADRSSIILIEGSERRFRLAGSHGLSDRYTRLLRTGEAKLRPGEGPSGVAYESRAPVVVADLDSDPRIASWAWRDIAREEGYRAIVSLPLMPSGQIVGTLNLYRTDPGPWPDEQVRLLAFFAEHAANAVRTAQLLDQRSRQLAALRRLVKGLREQTHEHANRLHAVGGLLALGDVDGAKELLHVLESAHTAIRRALDARIQHPTLAGLVLAESVVAGQRGITLALDERSRLERLPAMLSDTQLVTIVGNLLDNAFDAVANMPRDRRAVRLRVADEGEKVVIEVRDWGVGLPPGSERSLLDAGVSTKTDHQGLGLSLVHEAVTAAMGTLQVERGTDSTTFRVSIPNG
jgi:signal transduction histidine kinase